jgi:hypothetical protein
MTRTEIKQFMVKIYGPLGAYEARHAGVMEHLADKMRALRSFVSCLPADGKFAVVCEECSEKSACAAVPSRDADIGAMVLPKRRRGAGLRHIGSGASRCPATLS